MSFSPSDSAATKPLVSCSNIVDLPNEILNMILSYCDLKTIFTLKSTCKLFYNICSDEHLYRHIDLQPYWHMANDALVDQLAQSASTTTMINLSWTKLKSSKSLERQAHSISSSSLFLLNFYLFFPFLLLKIDF